MTAGTTPEIRILSVDDHAFLVEGLRARLAIEPDMEIVGRLPSAESLVRSVKETRASIVLSDIEMPGPDPFEAVRELNRQVPDVRAIFLSAFVRDGYIDAAYAVGAWGYLLKSDSTDEVVAGIRRVAQGELAFSKDVAARISERPKDSGSRLQSLTPRELEVLRLIARGMSRTDIAEELCRSAMTVDNHRKSIMKKLDINSRTELVRYAIAEGLTGV